MWKNTKKIKKNTIEFKKIIISEKKDIKIY